MGNMTASLALIFLFSNTMALTPAQRSVVAEAEKRLLASCCYSQAVGEHWSAEAVQMREDIEQMAASGESEAAIIEHYKAQYGERILAVPDGKTGNFLFTLPWAAFLIGSVTFTAIIRRMARADTHFRPRANQEEVDRWRAKYREAVERELRNWA